MDYRKIDFICPTSPKSGTTSLQNYLIQHPEIFLPLEKELQYFNFNFDKGKQWYFRHFLGVRDEKIVGEITPTYLIDEETIERIYNTLGANVKFILMLRDPVERLISEHLHNVRRGHIKVSLEKAISDELEGKYSVDEYKYYSILNNSSYASQLNRLLKYYKRDNIHTLILEKDFENKMINKALADICNFLEVSDFDFNHEIFKNEKYLPRFELVQYLVHQENHLRKIIRKILPGFNFRQRIRELIFKLNSRKTKVNEGYSEEFKKGLFDKYFVDQVVELEKLLDLDLSGWKR